jgi:hypothetical protein
VQLVQQLVGLLGCLQLGELGLQVTNPALQSGEFLDEMAVCNGGEMSQQGPGHVATFHGLTTLSDGVSPAAEPHREHPASAGRDLMW